MRKSLRHHSQKTVEEVFYPGLQQDLLHSTSLLPKSPRGGVFLFLVEQRISTGSVFHGCAGCFWGGNIVRSCFSKQIVKSS